MQAPNILYFCDASHANIKQLNLQTSKYNEVHERANILYYTQIGWCLSYWVSHGRKSVTVGVTLRNCVAYKSVSGHLAFRDDVNKDCFFLGHNIGAVSENY